jgi:adenylate cyclase
VTRPLRISFAITILTAFTLVFVLALGAVVLGYRQTGASAALAAAERSLAQAADTAAASTRALIRPVMALSAVLPEFAPLTEGLNPAASDTAAMLALLIHEPAIQIISVGLPDGTLRQVMRYAALTEEHGEGAPTQSAFALREAIPGQASENWYFLDAGLQPLGVLERNARSFLPGQTPWYLQASDAAVHVSTLYDLPLLGRPGISVSRRVPGSGAVVALDMTLDGLVAFLAHLRTTPASVLFLFTQDGIMLAHQRPELAAERLADGRTAWTTLMASPDPLIQTIWREYAQGALRVGQTARLLPDTRLGPQRADNRISLAPIETMLVRLESVAELAGPGMLVAVAAPVADFTRPLDIALSEGTTWALLALLLGLAGIGMLAWRISRPLSQLAQEADAIARLDLAAPIPVRSHITEIARLSNTMDGMKSALRVFGAYVPRSLVAKLMAEGDAARLGGSRRSISVMFSDVEGFTSLAEGIPPEELMQIASAYFEELTAELLRCHATIDKYIGDAVMALWNAPQDDLSHPRNACEAALRARLLTERLCDRFRARGWPRLRTRFGVHTGDAIVGNVGSSDRMSYTAIGSMVNLASRLEGMNKVYGTQILISEATRRAAGTGFVSRPVDLVILKGSAQPVELHELLGWLVVDRPADAELRADRRLVAGLSAWRRMISAYRTGQFDAASAALTEADVPSDDRLGQLYAERLHELRAGAPKEWTPVTRAMTK